MHGSENAGEVQVSTPYSIRSLVYHPRLGVQRDIYEVTCLECDWKRYSARKWKAERYGNKHARTHVELIPGTLAAEFEASVTVLEAA